MNLDPNGWEIETFFARQDKMLRKLDVVHIKIKGQLFLIAALHKKDLL
jgi:hypothetical protein